MKKKFTPENIQELKENQIFVFGSNMNGNQGAASATGNQGAASATGKESIALAAGKDCKAKGALGCWIVLTERGEWDGNTYPIISVKAFKVDGKSIKENTFYSLVNGEAVEMK